MSIILYPNKDEKRQYKPDQRMTVVNKNPPAL